MAVKSTVEEIRARFDQDVERFSNLETGQSATIDAPLVLDLITRAAAATNPRATSVLDIGCGAGNYTLKLLERLPGLSVTLIDLSYPMLERARARISSTTRGEIKVLQGDIREISLGEGKFDIILAAAVLHHLRGEDEWRLVFQKLYRSLKPGGSFWISDLIAHTIPAIHEMMWQRYGAYLSELKGEEYRDQVFAYIDREDTPRSILFQVDLLRQAGFRQVEILHKNSSFAAFGGVRD
ncbi:MAG TPA: methyltransferase domain-containing protein [Bryobacteraceae bacterium]|nr:methyltransferase domain-containing protein [Bryobacteraceae bacterium]